MITKPDPWWQITTRTMKDRWMQQTLEVVLASTLASITFHNSAMKNRVSVTYRWSSSLTGRMATAIKPIFLSLSSQHSWISVRLLIDILLSVFQEITMQCSWIRLLSLAAKWETSSSLTLRRKAMWKMSKRASRAHSLWLRLRMDSSSKFRARPLHLPIKLSW